MVVVVVVMVVVAVVLLVLVLLALLMLVLVFLGSSRAFVQQLMSRQPVCVDARRMLNTSGQRERGPCSCYAAEIRVLALLTRRPPTTEVGS